MDESSSGSPASTSCSSTGWTLKQYGRADYDQLLANVADLPADERRRLIWLASTNSSPIELACARSSARRDRAVLGIIKEAYRKLGVG